MERSQFLAVVRDIKNDGKTVRTIEEVAISDIQYYYLKDNRLYYVLKDRSEVYDIYSIETRHSHFSVFDFVRVDAGVVINANHIDYYDPKLCVVVTKAGDFVKVARWRVQQNPELRNWLAQYKKGD